MKRIDNSGKIFEITEDDIEIIVRLLNVECDHHVYHIDLDVDQGYFKERYDRMQDMIIELTK